MEIQIFSWKDGSSSILREQIRDIMIGAATGKSFVDEKSKEDFFNRWTQFYFEFFPQEFLCLSQNSQKVLGYLSGCSQSLESCARLEKDIPYFAVFSDLFFEYPAHLHINFLPEARGQGYGRQLIEHYIHFLNVKKIPGLHIVTSPTSDNQAFYRRLGFSFQCLRKWKEADLLFMGKTI